MFRTVVTDISSLGLKVKSTKFVKSENRTRCLLGLDLLVAIGVKTTQFRPQEVRPGGNLQYRYILNRKLGTK